MVDRTKWCEKREGERAVTWPHDIMQNTPFVYCECSDTHADSFLTNYGHLPIRVSLASVARDIRDGRQTALEFLKLLLPGIEGVEYPSWTILRKGAPLSQSRFWAHWPKSISGGEAAISCNLHPLISNRGAWQQINQEAMLFGVHCYTAQKQDTSD